MSDQIQPDTFGDFQINSASVPPPKDIRICAPLPVWLARRLLRAGETITWVRGPRFNPSWERYVTHPALFLVAAGLGAAVLGGARVTADSWSEVPAWPVFAAGGIAVASVYVLAGSAGYFTRLIVTSARVVILQGYEVCRSWNIDDLPPHLIRYDNRRGQRGSRAVDLDALHTALGGSSDQFVESKTILAFGKELDRITTREQGRPDTDRRK